MKTNISNEGLYMLVRVACRVTVIEMQLKQWRSKVKRDSGQKMHYD